MLMGLDYVSELQPPTGLLSIPQVIYEHGDIGVATMVLMIRRNQSPELERARPLIDFFLLALYFILSLNFSSLKKKQDLSEVSDLLKDTYENFKLYRNYFKSVVRTATDTAKSWCINQSF
jgi:hypothetical protein